MLTKIKDLLLRAIQFFKGAEATTESDKMDRGITLWEKMYEDDAPWLEDDVIESLGTPKTICEEMAKIVMNEASITVEGESDMAKFLNAMLNKHIKPRLREELEKGMAVGGFIMKPYVDGNEVMVDFCRQGEFRALGFDKDKHLIDSVFHDYYVEGKKTYTRVERQVTTNEGVTIENKTFVSRGDGLGDEINIALTRWSKVVPFIKWNETPERGLYGYYRVAKANNQDSRSALGMSIYGTAVGLIRKADYQYSRLDWEYEAGQMAVDVSEDAISPTNYTTPKPTRMDKTRERLYRKLSIGDDITGDTTYEVFAPTLRDANYIEGLDRYLMLIEDRVGLARGTLGKVAGDVRTATEVQYSQKKTYDTVHSNQDNLETALVDLVDAMAYLAYAYEIVEKGDYELVVGWDDSILDDYQTTLNRELQLVDAGIKSKAEVRAFVTGEDEETAQEKIDLIGSSTDIFAGLEGGE